MLLLFLCLEVFCMVDEPVWSIGSARITLNLQLKVIAVFLQCKL